MQEYREQTQEPRFLLIWGGNTDLHSLRPWGRGGHLPACKQRRTRAALGRKRQEPFPLPRQRKPGSSSATSSGAFFVFKHGSEPGWGKARKKHAASLGFPQDQIASGSGRDAGCLCSEDLSVASKWHERRCLCSGRKQAGTQKEGRGGTECLPPEPAWNRKLQQRRQENSSTLSPLCVLGTCEEWNQVMKNSDYVLVNLRWLGYSSPKLTDYYWSHSRKTSALLECGYVAVGRDCDRSHNSQQHLWTDWGFLQQKNSPKHGQLDNN